MALVFPSLENSISSVSVVSELDLASSLLSESGELAFSVYAPRTLRDLGRTGGAGWQSGQNQSVFGIDLSGGVRQKVWYPLSHLSHNYRQSSSRPLLQIRQRAFISDLFHAMEHSRTDMCRAICERLEHLASELLQAARQLCCGLVPADCFFFPCC